MGDYLNGYLLLHHTFNKINKKFITEILKQAYYSVKHNYLFSIYSVFFPSLVTVGQ